jgi:rhamnose transport system substrate-binding protein
MRFRILGVLLIILFVNACGRAGTATEYSVLYTPSSDGIQSEEQQQSDYTIAMVPKLEGIDYFNAVAAGAREAGRELGVNVIFRGADVADAGKQAEVIRQLIQQEVDVIAVSANDPLLLLPALQEADAKGIKVITWDADTEAAGRQFFVNMVDPETLGRHLMDTLAWNTAERGKFAIMTGSLNAANSNEWLHWIKKQNEEYYPHMEAVEIVETYDNDESAYRLAAKLLQDYPDLTGIIGNSSVGPPAAARAVEEAGLAGQVKVVGLSSPNQMRDYLKNGSSQVATLWSPKRLGYLTVILAKNLLDGTLPHDGQEINNVGVIRVKGDVVIMGEPLDFDKDNVDQYEF